jgi:hypothetical protein
MPQRIRWSQREIELPGKRPDSVAARKVGRTSYAVLLKRHSLGIPSGGETEGRAQAINGLNNGAGQLSRHREKYSKPYFEDFVSSYNFIRRAFWLGFK